MLAIDVVHRWQSWVRLVVAFLLWKLPWHLQVEAFRSFLENQGLTEPLGCWRCQDHGMSARKDVGDARTMGYLLGRMLEVLGPRNVYWENWKHKVELVLEKGYMCCRQYCWRGRATQALWSPDTSVTNPEAGHIAAEFVFFFLAGFQSYFGLIISCNGLFLAFGVGTFILYHCMLEVCNLFFDVIKVHS